MKRHFIFIALICSSFFSNAQTAEDSVKAVINTLFAGMKNSDAVSLRNAFTDSAILQTISRDASGKAIVQNESVNEFAEFIGKQPKGAADERIVYDVIKIDGPLAIVWAPYRFYFNGVFSHCGIDSFQLVKINNVWKILYLIDTRRKNGCEQ